jgi:hypothetical protein
MPYANMPWVRRGEVAIPTGGIAVDSPQWFAWLDTVSSFCYSSQSSSMRLTARREKRRQQFYWYGYCKVDAKLHNVYLGKREQLTQDRLEQACQQLWRKVRKEEAPGQH